VHKNGQHYDGSCETYKQEELLKSLDDPLVPRCVVVTAPCLTLTQVITQHVNESLYSHMHHKYCIALLHSYNITAGKKSSALNNDNLKVNCTMRGTKYEPVMV